MRPVSSRGPGIALSEISCSICLVPFFTLRLLQQPTVWFNRLTAADAVLHTQRLLTSTEMSVAGIADAVGFSIQSHCTHYIRETVGVTPSDYRQLAGNFIDVFG